ncbi:Gfo/Idh/MocA family protein [Armatimonas sp.]|uniref:Gfo/Idh/MocA family protein n=1 Tax=Armatimonas sp. TaxID=1872638 RepID=UPI00374D47E8
MSSIQTMRGVAFAPRETVRLTLIGCGGRGRGMLRELLACPKVQIVAVYDVSEEAAQKAATVVREKGKTEPKIIVGGDVRQVLDINTTDLAYIATPWSQHVPYAVAAMEAGLHAAVEVPAAVTLDECWAMVETSERTRRHCIQLENCCYGDNELMMVHLAHTGKLGTLTHGEAAYIHDLRHLLLSDQSEGLWRREPHKNSDGNFYPTHGLGPVAQAMGIHRGDRFTRLISMSSREASLTETRDVIVEDGNPKRSELYKAGDMNTSLIQTARGRTIMLQHDVVTPRPYSRGTLLQGSKGAFRDWPAGVFLEADPKTPHHGGWADIETIKEEFEHPLWKELREKVKELGGGHGGMDFVMNWRLVQCLHEGLVPDMDVYDAAAWSAPGPLSEDSVRLGNMPVEFPDFTRGHWE